MAEIVETNPRYDEIPYESHPFRQTHPDRLTTMGRLFGLKPKPVTDCRVLELGCSGGGNIIPMAMNLPDSEFVGVELSKVEVDIGRSVIKELGLENIRIEHCSIMDVDSSWGKFDYIISHGVYSWIPDDVRDKLVGVSGDNLDENGVAYISYNTYPGWHMREMIRHMMLFHSKQFDDPKKVLEQSRAMIDFLSKSVPTENNHYGMLLKTELDLIKRSQDYYLYHDHLEIVNEPVYFHQFIEQAAGHGLQYLGEAELGSMMTTGFSSDVEETLKRISPDIVRKEQYMDFLRNRLFRMTLLCHADKQLKRNLGPDDIRDLLFASNAKPAEDNPPVKPGNKLSFKIPSGASIQSDNILLSGAFKIFQENWPRAVDFDTVWTGAMEFIDNLEEDINIANEIAAKNILLTNLLQSFSANVVEIKTWQPEFTNKVSKKPKVSPLTLLQSKTRNSVVNQRHETVSMDVVVQNMVSQLNGENGLGALKSHMKGLVKDGVLRINDNGRPVSDPKIVDQALKVSIERGLKQLAANSLLIA